MQTEVTILMAEDDDGHATLVTRNLQRCGISNVLVRFKDGSEVLDYLFRTGDGPQRGPDQSLLLLLDIRMPRVDGVEVLRQMKEDPELKRIPVIMLTTTDDPREVDKCYELGCNSYIAKPVSSEKFVHAIKQLGMFLTVVSVPTIP